LSGFYLTFDLCAQAGIQRHFELGKWLRNRYRGWLPEIYDAEDVYVRSTDFDRTLMSAEANLAGMYPPVGPRDWNGAPGKRVQLIPIHTAPKSQDNVSTQIKNVCIIVHSAVKTIFAIRLFSAVNSFLAALISYSVLINFKLIHYHVRWRKTQKRLEKWRVILAFKKCILVFILHLLHDRHK